MKKNPMRINSKVYWYRFWKTAGPNGGFTEEYVFYASGFGLFCDSQIESRAVLKPLVHEDCKRWAEKVGGGFSSHYEYGFEAKRPPKKVLQKMIDERNERIDTLHDEVMLLSFDMPRSQKALDFIIEDSKKHRVKDKDLQELLEA